MLGHLRGLYVGYKYSYIWLISTMNPSSSPRNHRSSSEVLGFQFKALG